MMSQNRESDYNQHGYVHQELRAEEVDQLGLPLREQLDLPAGLQKVRAGADLGLGDSPTVFSVFSQEMVRMKGDRRAQERLKLVRRFTCQRFRQRQIVELWLALGFHFHADDRGQHALPPRLRRHRLDAAAVRHRDHLRARAARAGPRTGARDVMLHENRQVLHNAARVRMPRFTEDITSRERVDALEDYLNLTAVTRGELEEARLHAQGALRDLTVQWEAIEGWEIHVKDRRSDMTRATITAAKPECRPDLHAVA